MAHVLEMVALGAALAVAAWLAVRYLVLKRSLRRADAELREIVACLEDNRIVRLPSPDADLEAFLATVNRALEGIRLQAVAYAHHEAELKAQVERISHDLRTPLTSLRGYLALVDEAGLDDDGRDALATVKRKAASLERLVEQFYDLSRAQAGDASLELESVDVGRLVREAVAGQHRLLAERGLDVRLSAPERAVLARANADAVDRVVANLLHNAGKYARTTLEIEVREVGADPAGEAAPPARSRGARGRRVAVGFANDADAIEEGEVARLFQPFYQADASRSQEGTGLGLAIARHLLERMGGAIEARRDLRDGATWLCFLVTLPAAEPPDAAAPAARDDPSAG